MPDKINASAFDDINIELVRRIQAEAIKGLKVRFRDIILPRMIKDAAHEGRDWVGFSRSDIPQGVDAEFVKETLKRLEERGFRVLMPSLSDGFYKVYWRDYEKVKG